MRELTIKVHAIAEDGLPDMDAIEGHVAFLFDGCIVSGWPLGTNEDGKGPYSGYWEADSDVGRHVQFDGVTHWVEFPVRLYAIEDSAKAGMREQAAWWRSLTPQQRGEG